MYNLMKTDISIDTAKWDWTNLPKNIVRLAVIGPYILPRLGLIDDDGAFIKEVHPRLGGGYITVDGDKWDYFNLRDYDDIVWC